MRTLGLAASYRATEKPKNKVRVGRETIGSGDATTVSLTYMSKPRKNLSQPGFDGLGLCSATRPEGGQRIWWWDEDSKQRIQLRFYLC
jgi:hypothetical protein